MKRLLGGIFVAAALTIGALTGVAGTEVKTADACDPNYGTCWDDGSGEYYGNTMTEIWSVYVYYDQYGNRHEHWVLEYRWTNQ